MFQMPLWYICTGKNLPIPGGDQKGNPKKAHEQFKLTFN